MVSSLSSSTIFGVYGLSFSYERGKAVLSEVSFELSSGEVLALLGPNGCGKSTLLKVASGIVPLKKNPDCSGLVRFRGNNFLDDSPGLRSRHVAYVGYEFRIEFPMSAYDAVMLGRTSASHSLLKYATEKDRTIVRDAMERCLCWSLRDKNVETLSAGQRQLVALARGLAQGSPVLLLDEALSQMDLDHQAAMGRLLRALAKEGKSIVLVAHDVNLAAEWADTCLLMKAGRHLAFGPTRDVLTQERIRAVYPGADLIVGSNPATGTPKVFFGRT